MYLSRLTLNPRNRSVRRDLADCHALHRSIMAAFPDMQGASGAARAALGVLYRVETSGPSGPMVLVQSEQQPDWTRLEAEYVTGAVTCKRVDQIYSSLDAGRVLTFRLLANPTRKIKTRSGPNGERNNGTRVELHGEEEWLAWLRRKADQHGFELLSARATSSVSDVRTAPHGKIIGLRKKMEAEHSRLTLFSVQFDGRLAIRDRLLFLASLRNGVGPGKAYGLGLLSIAPG